jgi:hypothetical protein
MTQALQSTVDLNHATEMVVNVPVVSHFKQLATRAQSLAEDVHAEVMDMYSVRKILSCKIL